MPASDFLHRQETQKTDVQFRAKGMRIERVLIGFDETVSYCEKGGRTRDYTPVWKIRASRVEVREHAGASFKGGSSTGNPAAGAVQARLKRQIGGRFFRLDSVS